MLRTLVPLKVVVVTEKPGREHRAIRGAIARAFQGGPGSSESAEAYYACGEDLGVAVLDADFATGADTTTALVDRAIADALHCLVVVILYDNPKREFLTWLNRIDRRASGAGRPDVGLLPVLMREDLWQGSTQPLPYSTLGEYALRPAYVAAHALAHAWRLLAEPGQKLKLFISHAKLDGLPLAHAFRAQIQALHGVEKFYDALDIPAGSNWREELRKGVENSVIVALRTNVYEDRFWCVQELDWAEDYGCPLVVVDARTHLVRAREFLPIVGSPSAQVPDGNLPRVLQSALREALRVRLFARQVGALIEEGLIKDTSALRVPRTALSTLGMRCQDHAKEGKQAEHVFVPEPFREAHRPIARALGQAYFPGAWVGTPGGWLRERFIGVSDSARDNFLSGMTISIAVSHDPKSTGFTEREMNRSVVRFAEELLKRGARLVFGHDWRPEGIMAAVSQLAVRFGGTVEESERTDADADRSRIESVLPWPDEPELPLDLRRELEHSRTLRIEEMPEPREAGSDRLVARAFALSELRARLTDLCDARICLGGKRDRFEGFWAGILEEALAAAAAKKPVYVSRAMGGVAADIVAGANGANWESMLDPETGRSLRQEAGDRAPKLPDARALLARENLQPRSGLSSEEWTALVEATDIEVIIAYVLKGLFQLSRDRERSP